MARRILIMATASALVAMGFVFGTVTSLALLPGGGPAKKVGEVHRLVQRYYPDDVPPERLERAALTGMLKAVDDHSEYFTAEQWREWRPRHMEGKFDGVGVQVEPDPKTGYYLVTTPIEDSPAFQADVLPGDLILAVDGVDIKNQAFEEVVYRIRGEPGSKVTLTLSRPGKDRFDVPLVRAEVKIRAVHHKMVDAQAGIGLVRISEFTEMLPDFDRAMSDLQSKGLRALVIDLRFNGGGLLSSAVEVCDRFLPSGRVVVAAEGKRPGDRREYRTRSDADLPSNIPVVVLVNGLTASASEIVAGALRDHGRAVLVGSRTYGKGTVQTPFDLSDGSHLKLTTARWVTPNGVRVGPKDANSPGGLVPDYVVEMTREEETALLKKWWSERVVKGPPPPVEPVKDFPLEAGLEIVRAKLADRPASVTPREVAKIPTPEPK
ncbi:MAG TPA: S41 family peptidase [Planctomycetota bacterium]